MRRRLALAAIPMLIALSAFPAPVGAVDGATVTVTADMPSAVPAGHSWAFDDFFPRGLTVAQGTTVDFAIEGFHTATLLAHGTTVAADMLASGLAGEDADDTAKNLNGSKPHTVFRLPALAPQLPSAGCGTAANPCTFDGSTTVSSGAPDPSAGPFAVTVDAAPGVYLFHCRIHPKMVATLRVVASGSPAAQTAAQVSAAAQRQVKVDAAEAKIAEARLSAHAMSRNPNGTATWRVSAGGASANGFVSLLEFLPRNISLHRGDRVLWVAPDANEPHTITFPGDLHSDMVPMCEGPNGTDTPATPTVNPPAGPQDFACGSGPADEIELDGGNGVRRLSSASTVADSGIIASPQVAAGYGLPASALIHTWSVTLQPDAAKTVYHYVCQIHEGMAGTITVH